MAAGCVVMETPNPVNWHLDPFRTWRWGDTIQKAMRKMDEKCDYAKTTGNTSWRLQCKHWVKPCVRNCQISFRIGNMREVTEWRGTSSFSGLGQLCIPFCFHVLWCLNEIRGKVSQECAWQWAAPVMVGVILPATDPAAAPSASGKLGPTVGVGTVTSAYKSTRLVTP